MGQEELCQGSFSSSGFPPQSHGDQPYPGWDGGGRGPSPQTQPRASAAPTFARRTEGPRPGAQPLCRLPLPSPLPGGPVGGFPGCTQAPPNPPVHPIITGTEPRPISAGPPSPLHQA